MYTTSSSRDQSIEIRHSVEERFHDAKAGQALEDFYVLNPLEIADAFSVAQLGELNGRRLLEIGCGDGRLCVQFARAGAWVTAIDISSEMVARTNQSASEAGVRDHVEAIHMSAETLSLPDDSFDLIYGHSVLHHLDLTRAARQFSRILRERGAAVFLEPLDGNPLLKFFRRLTPHRRTSTEAPLTLHQLEFLSHRFRSFEHREFYLCSLLAFVWYYIYRNDRLFRRTVDRLHVVDERCFRSIPSLRHLAWVSVLTLTK